MHSTHLEISSLLPLFRPLSLNSGYQLWWRVLLSTEPSLTSFYFLCGEGFTKSLMPSFDL